MGILRQVQTEATTNLISSHRKPLLLIPWSFDTQQNSIKKKKETKKEKKICSYLLRFENSTWIKGKRKEKKNCKKGEKYVRIPYASRSPHKQKRKRKEEKREKKLCSYPVRSENPRERQKPAKYAQWWSEAKADANQRSEPSRRHNFEYAPLLFLLLPFLGLRQNPFPSHDRAQARSKVTGYPAVRGRISEPVMQHNFGLFP